MIEEIFNSRASKGVDIICKGKRPEADWVKGIKEQRESILVDKCGVDFNE